MRSGAGKGVVITVFQRLSSAGFCATAIGFGPARMGFGLFVPEFREAFSVSTSAVGIISSLGFLGFFIGLCVTQLIMTRHGPNVAILAGLAAAAVGMGMVGAATGIAMLAAGVFLAATSAGLAWTPFNATVQQVIAGTDRASALSIISSGTGIGIALAGAAALVMSLADLSWRAPWAVFAAAAALAALWNWRVFRHVDREQDGARPTPWRDLKTRAVLPLIATGLAYGTTSAVFIAFAADHAVQAGGVPGLPVAMTPAVIYICYGLVGLGGLLTGRIEAAIGLPWLIRLLMLAGAASVALIGLAPTMWVTLSVAAGLQGLHVMMTSAVLSFWSERLFPAIPSLSFTAALLAAAAGSILGPALGGLVAEIWGSGPMLLLTAILPAATALLFRDRHGQGQTVPR